MESKPLIEISTIEKIVYRSGFTDAFATISPYSSDFPTAISALLGLAGEKLHKEIVNCIPDYDSLTAYRNVIAISMGSPFLVGAITRATLCADSQEVNALHGPLSESLKKAVKSDPGLCWLYVSVNEDKPSIPTSCYFTPSLRLRYTLAGEFRQRIRAGSWIKSIPKHPGCSRLAAQRELRRALFEAGEAGATVKPLSEAALYSLPIALQILVTGDSLLSQAFISSRANVRKISADVAKNWKVRMKSRKDIVILSG
jgi:hypothetical protein